MFVKKEYMKIWEVRISPSCRTIVPTYSRLVTTKDFPLCAGTKWTLDLGVPDGVPDGPPTMGQPPSCTSYRCATGTFSASSWLPPSVPRLGKGSSFHWSGRRGKFQGFRVPPSWGAGIQERVRSHGMWQVLWELSPWCSLWFPTRFHLQNTIHER